MNSGISGWVVAGLATMAALSLPVRADVVYDTTATQPDYIDQQFGNNFYSLGEQVQITPTSAALNTISIVFGSSSLGSAFTYTPDITLSLYDNAADADLHNGTGLLGSAVVNNVTFTNDGQIAAGDYYNYEDQQLLTFNFASQNVVLPSTFVIAYHDDASLDSNGTTDGAAGLSVGLTDQLATVGTSTQATFDTYPDGSSSTLDYTWDAGLNIEAQITSEASTAPLPASAWSGMALLVGVGGFLAVKHLRRRTVVC